ncbi:glucosaminidase [Psychromonas sp. MB-3u-54]|uniref:glucosaminidase domain-containing protein n=1 Tax=Psychromonas sp. MB-3u-54 TaxID=2058319 RepID=UPI000C31F710|nr:glucosaminidase domain-containing protein [Psychromonas sp. MB-3u-54]PKH02656.1 glucosaminidase [Psychromonas sp. MB-3u-54]
MTKLFSARYIALTLISCLLIGACSYVLNSSSESEKLMANPIEVTITSLDDLNALFDKYQYNNENWNKGNREVPRITFEGVGKHWAEGSKKLPVETKKMIFFRLMTPLALVSNENILREREIVKSSPLDALKLKNIAIKYRVIKDKTDELDKEMRNTLLARVDILPPSLALAQAAEESGWATSRFTQEGNAFFGQWDFTGNGMKPRAHRKELGDYGVARFDSPLASVEGYMLNINSNSSYQKLRVLRSELRADDQAATGIKLAGTLDKYSERGQEYIEGLRAMIRYNKLEQVDQAYLSDNKLIHLITEK